MFHENGITDQEIETHSPVEITSKWFYERNRALAREVAGSTR